MGLCLWEQGEGTILPVETIALPGTGRLRLKGSLGVYVLLFFTSNRADVLTLSPRLIGDQRKC